MFDASKSASWNGNKSECPQGHSYTAENTYRHTKTGSRLCRTCRRINNADTKRRIRANKRVEKK